MTSLLICRQKCQIWSCANRNCAWGCDTPTPPVGTGLDKDVVIVEARLSADMKRVYEWCTDDELILNLQKGKTESMLFGTPKYVSHQLSVLNISLGDKTVNFTTKYKYLGCIIEPSLNMNSHFESSNKKQATE